MRRHTGLGPVLICKHRGTLSRRPAPPPHSAIGGPGTHFSGRPRLGPPCRLFSEGPPLPRAASTSVFCPPLHPQQQRSAARTCAQVPLGPRCLGNLGPLSQEPQDAVTSDGFCCSLPSPPLPSPKHPASSPSTATPAAPAEEATVTSLQVPASRQSRAARPALPWKHPPEPEDAEPILWRFPWRRACCPQ